MMIKAKSLIILLSIIMLCGYWNDSTAKEKTENSFETREGKFWLNGEPFTIKAAELHYPRIPREYWENRIEMAKALGMNTVCLYVFWNIHEQNEGEFDFTDNNDLRHFIELCDKNGLKVILRPGPYVCAEWEMGGLPWWLLRKKDIRLRENDPYFLNKVEEFQKNVARQVGDLTIDNGGPIIMIQVENEYGSYGVDKEYVANIRDILKQYFGDGITLFQCDWSSNFTLNGLDDLLWTMNFGTGANIDAQFSDLKRLRPDSPLMCSEFWSGWFDKWGANHETRPADDMIAGIDEMLSKDISFSLYMTHGGSNWGHWAGANSPGYAPDVTSYDYDAPINENGQPTPKFWKLRETMAKYLNEGENLPELPDLIPTMEIQEFTVEEVAPLWCNLPISISCDSIKTIEELGMGFGSIIYSTTLPPTSGGSELIISDVHDFAQIFLEGELVGSLDRRHDEKSLRLPGNTKPAKLDILVEATGRINFGRAIKDYKGITDKVEIKEDEASVTELTNWTIYLLPDSLAFYNTLAYKPIDDISSFTKEERLPIGIYKGKFKVKKTDDTFLNMENWGKGLVYINGHPLGRFWNIGPQQTLYLPGSWLKAGENDIMIFDIVGPTANTISGMSSPILDKLNVVRTNEFANVNFENYKATLKTRLKPGLKWQTVKLPKNAKGRYVCIEILTGRKGTNPGVAEIYLLDKDGKRIRREKWKGMASSQISDPGNHTVEKIFDLQETTYWAPQKGKELPSYFIIDMKDEYEISGLEILQPHHGSSDGGIKDIKLFISSTPFK